MPSANTATSVITEVVDKHSDDLVALRRDLHAHPELSWAEMRTSDAVVTALEPAGWSITRPDGGGVLAEIGHGEALVALRADLDALPIDDHISDPWKSTVPGVAHACGHDVHTTGLIGAGLALAEVATRGLLPGRVRLLFQPAEEVMPGGALHLISSGALEGVCARLRPALRPQPRRRPHRPARGPADRCRRLADRPPDRQGRPHLAPAPDRGPHLRARQGDHRAARHPEPPPRPAGRGQRGLGDGARGLGAQRDPARRRRRRAPSGCSTRSPGPTRST